MYSSNKLVYDRYMFPLLHNWKVLKKDKNKKLHRLEILAKPMFRNRIKHVTGTECNICSHKL